MALQILIKGCLWVTVAEQLLQQKGQPFCPAGCGRGDKFHQPSQTRASLFLSQSFRFFHPAGRAGEACVQGRSLDGHWGLGGGSSSRSLS